MSEIVAFFTNAGAPLVGPGTAPTVRIRRTDTQALVVTDDAMTEIGDGLFSYTFAPTAGIDYSIRADGDPLVAGQVTASERYVAGSLSGDTEAAEDATNANVDATISSRATQASVDVIDANVDTINANVDVAVSSRASQVSLDATDLVVDAINSNVDVAVSTRSSQASVDVVDTNVDAINANVDVVLSSRASQAALALAAADVTAIDANVDVAVSTRASQVSLDATDLVVDDTNAKVTAIDADTGDTNTKTTELWQKQGLDVANPATIAPGEITTGAITIDIVQTTTETTLTRS